MTKCPVESRNPCPLRQKFSPNTACGNSLPYRAACCLSYHGAGDQMTPCDAAALRPELPGRRL